MLGERAVRAGGIALALSFAIMGGLLYVVPTFGLTTLGWEASKAGAAIGVAATMLVVGALAASRILAGGRIGPKPLALAGFAAILAGSGALALAFSPSSGFGLIAVLVMIVGLGPRAQLLRARSGRAGRRPARAHE